MLIFIIFICELFIRSIWLDPVKITSIIYESSAVSIVCVISIGSDFVMGTNTPVCGDAFVRTFWHWNLCVPIIYTHSLMYYWIFPRLYGV